MLGFISTAIIIGHIVAEVNVYAYQGSQAHIAAWRAFSFVTSFYPNPLTETDEGGIDMYRCLCLDGRSLGRVYNRFC